MPTRAYTAGGLEDLLYIVAGIALWGLGIDMLAKARRMSTKSKVVTPAPRLVPVASGHGAVVLSVATVRFLNFHDISFFILIAITILSFFYSYTLLSRPKKRL